MNGIVWAAWVVVAAADPGGSSEAVHGGVAALGEPPAVTFAFVPAADVQPGGPAYDFRISTFEVRNDQFAAFLNDARANPGNPRGSNMHFDPQTWNVHVGTSSTGPIMFRMVSVEEGGQIVFESGAYAPIEGFENHPVANVSWYGAVKYCNWLTIDAGLGEAARAYTEGPLGADWHPVTITRQAWATRDLSAAERDALIDEYLGHRLPMDGGSSSAGPYNEWYKAAAARFDGQSIVFDSLYGFGRGTIANVDANYLASADPFEPGTSPVGFYDGVNLLADGVTPTRDTANAYALYDLSGNVWEWMQDQRSTNPLERRTRGGSWDNATFLLRVNQAVTIAASDADARRGFRIVQSVPDGFLLTPVRSAITGPWGGPYDPSDTVELTIENVTDLDGVQFSAEVVGELPWIVLSVDPEDVIELGAGERTTVFAQVDPICADELSVGAHDVAVRVTRLDTQGESEAAITLTIAEPLSVSPGGDYDATVKFASDNMPPAKTYTMRSASDAIVSWSATVEYDPAGDEWLVVPTSGDVPPGPDGIEIDFAIDGNVARALAAGRYRATVTIRNECTGTTFVRRSTLTVGNPFRVDRETGAEFRGLYGRPIVPDEEVFTITSETDVPIEWSATADYGAGETDWIELSPTGGVLEPETPVEVSARVLEIGLPVGVHDATLHFIDGTSEETTGFDVERDVTADVVDYVQPPEGVDIIGPEGGPFEPIDLSYTLQNIEPFAQVFVLIEVEYGEGAADWLDVPDELFFLADPPDDFAGVDIEVNGVVKGIPARPEPYTATLRFHRPDLEDVFVERVVSLLVESESTAFAVAMRNVPIADVQAGGPTHHFRIGAYEVTNREFARFLNDARAHPDDERGSYVYFDTDSGSVYIHDQRVGGRGSGPPGGEVTLLYNAAIGKLTFEGSEYKSAREDFWLPVVGVSWYGAAKFCNWLTVAQGMDPAERAYTEGPTAAAWTPILFDPNDFPNSRVGYRLPRDDGTTTASRFNEWFKAASRKGVDANGNAVFGAVYGYGRDQAPNGVDANYQPSGDPFASVTPVGFYGVDGLRRWDDPRYGWGESPPETFDVLDTDNGYGLYDLCGNVAEWVHERSGTSGATRGGHFANGRTDAALRNDNRTVRSAGATLSFVGFRVAQSYAPTTLAIVQDDDQVRARGPVGGPYAFDNPDGTFTVRVINDGRYAVDALGVEVRPAGVLEVISPPMRQIAPGAESSITLAITEDADDVTVSPAPPGSVVLIAGSDVQVGGPTHDYWISTTEVRNDQFVVFLNDALANLENERGHYLYFDIDTGIVYVNDEMVGATGSGPPEGTAIPIFDPALGDIAYSSGTYSVDDALRLHPVVGVSWFGAVKYCNWLTVFADLPPGLRAYLEAPADRPLDWAPVSTDPDTLITRTVGYRLPMDGGLGGAGRYNEWYKAASRGGSNELGEPLFDAVFGYGRRDPPTPVDANYLESDDPFGDVTPPGFYGIDGDRRWDDPLFGWGESPPETFTVADTSNGYGIYDLCGNVVEWAHDWFRIGDTNRRAVRGGGFNDPADAPVLRADGRSARAAASLFPDTGFRVVRGTGHVIEVTITDHVADITHVAPLIIDLTPPWTITPRADAEWSGMYGARFDELPPAEYTATNVSATPIDWSARLTIQNGGQWIELDATEGTLDESGGDDPDATVPLLATPEANALAPGEYTASVIFEARHGETLVYGESREARLTVEQPVSVTPEETVEIECVRGTCTSVEIDDYVFEKIAGIDLDYRVSVEPIDGWLEVAPVPPTEDLDGLFPPGGVVAFAPSVNESADDLDCGEYEATLRFEFIDRSNEDLTVAAERALSLTVRDYVEIIGEDPAEVPMDRENLPAIDYELINHHDAPIGMQIAIVEPDVDWLDIDDPNPTLPPGTTPWSVQVNDAALELPDGRHEATIEFTNALTGCVQTRGIVLIVGNTLTVTPATGLSSGGIVGTGPFAPGRKVYTLYNAPDGGEPLDWEVVRDDADADWLRIDGGDFAAGTLEDGEARRIVLSIDEGRAVQLSEGGSPYTLNVVFKQRGGAETVFTSRPVSLIIARPQFSLTESVVSTAAAQPGGPAHGFRVGTHPVTNNEYAAFLNDAIAHLDDDKGAYMFFDTETLPGNVYINEHQAGARGAGPPAGSVVLLYEATNGQAPVGRIQWDGVQYIVEAGFEDHPAVGMTWYGAVKYCNWLSLDQGVVPEARCYTEDVNENLGGWRPATISESAWATRDLNASERLALVAAYRGFRLPMDQGYNNPSPDPPSERAEMYNEWYKAAAWNESIGANTIYGFGRNTITGADANYRDSGDPFDNGTTPVGYYDGSDHGGAFPTNPNENTFGLFDMTGNVSEWVQGHFNTTLPQFRTLRGGSWNQVVSLMDVRSRSAKLATTTSDRVGFRVVRASPPADGDSDGDGVIGLADYVLLHDCLEGPAAPADGACEVFDFDGSGTIDLHDFTEFQRRFDEAP